MLRQTTRGLLAVLTVGLIVSCSSLPEPSEEWNTLVIGSVIKKGTIAGVPSSINLGDEFVSGISITFENGETHKALKVISDKNGLFYSTSFLPGRYVVASVGIKRSQGTASFGEEFTFSAGPSFVVEPGKVNDIGVLSWDKLNSRNRVTLTPQSGTALATLAAAFPKSTWLAVPLVHP